MARSRARIPVTTSLASLAMLIPTSGCRRPSADLNLPSDGNAVAPEPAPGQAPAAQACPSVPKPPPGSPDDHESPTIVGARFVARDRVQLTFSEPLAPVAGVNPRQFRLSHAYSMVDGVGNEGYATGYYYDLAGADPYDPPMVFVQMELYADQPEVVALTLSAPVPDSLCETIVDTLASLSEEAGESETPRHGEVGLYLHYTERGSDGVRDKVNNPLRDIGADWALNFGSRHKTVYGTEPVMRLDLLVPIVCPDPNLGPGGPPGPI